MTSMSRVFTRRLPVDERLPGFETLLTDSVPGPVAVVYDMAGSTVDDINAIQANWRPGRKLTVRYRVQASGGRLGGRADVVATIGEVSEGATLVEGTDCTVGLWVVPDDPSLPGLSSALHLPTVTNLIRNLGSTDVVGFSRLRAYRPGRRAVVEVGAGSSSIFLKVVPPAEVAALHERHRLLSDHLPVPDSLGVAYDLGIVVMRAMPGSDLRRTLRQGGPAPDSQAIAALVEELPDPWADWQTRSTAETLPGVIDLLQNLLPEQSERLDQISDEIALAAPGRRVPVHGDFHEAQIIAEANRPLGLIDVDTYGWGESGDDAATMLAHLHLLAPECRSPHQVIEMAAALNRRWDASFDPATLRRRVAAVVLGLATGPFRVLAPDWAEGTLHRIGVAEEWLESARRIDERSLTPTSASSHLATR
jgi:hypothetical protein